MNQDKTKGEPMDGSYYALQENSRDYERIGAALTYIAEHWGEQPKLGEVAASVGMSEYHFQRVFSRWVGISPKRFLSLVTLERAKESLAGQASVLDASFDSGLSGPGRLHDLFVSLEAMTPGEFKRAAEGLTIRYGWHDGPFGPTLIMETDRGLCGLAFLDDRGYEGCFADMAARWPGARLVEDSMGTSATMARIFAAPKTGDNGAPIRLFVKGTAFQVKVWEGLMALPPGELSTYGHLAEALGLPKNAARAVGTAVGANPISWVIPCHRVIRQTGMLGGYRWGLPRKVAMIGREACGDGVRAHLSADRAA